MRDLFLVSFFCIASWWIGSNIGTSMESPGLIGCLFPFLLLNTSYALSDAKGLVIITVVSMKSFLLLKKWYCPSCKRHHQAIKKLDLRRLPEILVIYLKRFSYSRFLKNKLEIYIDFPVDNLNLSSYILHKNSQLSNRYMLYAASNHYGSMGGGHYTAFVHRGGDQWYNFDDSHVYPINQEKIKTSAAYLLFYRRVVE